MHDIQLVKSTSKLGRFSSPKHGTSAILAAASTFGS